MLTFDDALKESKETVKAIEKARAAAQRRDYATARRGVSDAVSSASYVDAIYLSRCTSALENAK
jgi:hypothetical protein